MNSNLKSLSKAMSHALRHAPENYGITLDKDGWTSLSGLLAAIGNKNKFLRGYTLSSVNTILQESDKVRFMVDGDNIRACYGHSIDTKIKHEPKAPVQFLYHGTPTRNLESIMKNGLLPMNRQYVHSSEDKDTACMVARRWNEPYTILVINAWDAWESNIDFFNGNDDIWLSNSIPPEFIQAL